MYETYGGEIGELPLERGDVANLLKNAVIVERAGERRVVGDNGLLGLLFLLFGHGGRRGQDEGRRTELGILYTRGTR